LHNVERRALARTGHNEEGPLPTVSVRRVLPSVKIAIVGLLGEACRPGNSGRPSPQAPRCARGPGLTSRIASCYTIRSAACEFDILFTDIVSHQNMRLGLVEKQVGAGLLGYSSHPYTVETGLGSVRQIQRRRKSGASGDRIDSRSISSSGTRAAPATNGLIAST
jgi:hypothetical protein